MMNVVKQGALVVATIVGALSFAKTASADLEEPAYEVLDSRDGFEIRLYKPYIVAETTTTGTAREAGRKGFQILAGYIFGGNTAAARMKMTTPVTTRSDGEKMNMTAPVTVTKSAKESYRMRFVMERKYTMKVLPKPNDSRVSLIEIPERTVAVLRYSGSTTDKRFEKKRDLLLERLAEAEIKAIAEPIKAIFNGPWTPGILRRNEAQVEVEWDKK